MAVSPSSSSSCSSGSVLDASEEKTNGTRLSRLLIDEGTNVLRRFLDSVYQPEALAHELQKNRLKLSERPIFRDQWEKLFPSSDDPPDSKTFDITLLHFLIREVCNLPKPFTGWHKMPADDDHSLEANITRIKCFRNELCHSVSTNIPNDEFEDKWNKIATSLEAIEIDVHRQKFRGYIQGLKNALIDHKTFELIEKQVQQWQKFQQQEEIISQVQNYLPHTPTQVSVRSQELRQVIEYVESGTVALVLITGGPGFGKSTLAKAVAHELAKSENERSVLFCRLLSKGTFNEVVTEMIHSCGKSYAQPPEHPDRWLMDWSKRIQMQVTFVLDNADDVLESEESIFFLSILTEMRQSSQKVTFVITSRKQFETPDLPSKDVVLSSLTSEQAKEVLISQVNDEEVRKNLSTTKEIVKLCGYVPLALCIVGSLLSDYTEERLVEHLKKEPMKLLDDGSKSVETAIKTSFDLLSKDKRDALILLSIFPGSFKSNAAVVVISKTCLESGTLPVSVLRSLKNSSLVEKPSSGRYQLHPLIRAFGKRVGQTSQSKLVETETLACAHFMSLLNQYAETYWKKDTCKESIDSFNEDRQNFEYFCQVYAKRMEIHDEEIISYCVAFQENFLQKLMYLEKCTPPGLYTQVLQMLLKSFTEPKIRPVQAVEIMCLLGHEKRKVGDKESYKFFIQNAKEIYLENEAEFASNAVSEVFMLNSYTDFVSKRGDPADNEQVQEFSKRTLKVCDERLEACHPEKAEALLLGGRFAKRSRNPSEAQKMLKEALEVFQKRLGNHLMTVHALKETGDFFLSREIEENWDKAMIYYTRALNMMKQLGMEGTKDNINIMKNYGACAMKKGNHQEALEYLEKACHVANRELEADHNWKVQIKTRLALLYDKIGKVKDGIILMKEGLRMAQRLLLPIRALGKRGSADVLEYLENHPEEFPTDEFSRY